MCVYNEGKIYGAKRLGMVAKEQWTNRVDCILSRNTIRGYLKGLMRTEVLLCKICLGVL